MIRKPTPASPKPPKPYAGRMTEIEGLPPLGFWISVMDRSRGAKAARV